MIVGMPYKLAFLGINSADRVIKTMDDIGISTKNVYIGGHSLGGSARASFVSKNSDKIEGLILLASYSTSDLSDKDIKVLSLYGTQDGVMHKNFYDKCWKNLPDNTIEIIIDGGNHAYFGAYGNQKGDYSALISHEEQIEITAQAIIDFIQSDK